MRQKTESVLTVKQMTVSYDHSSALWDISFELSPGQIVGIIGPNGAGKSTLLKALIGIVTPISGQVTFFGDSFDQVRKQIAYVPQKGTIDWDFPVTVFDVVLMGRYGRLNRLKWYRKADREMATYLLSLLEMEELKNRQIRELSGGQQQRLFLARALMQEADLLLLDEPFAGVDKGTEGLIIEILRKLKKEGKTAILVHHDLNTVRAYFDSLVVLKTSLIACGKTSEVLNGENLRRAYGQKGALFDEAFALSLVKSKGLR